MSTVQNTKFKKSLKKMLLLRETLKSIITFDKTGDICSEFIREAEDKEIDLVGINSFLTNEETKSFGSILVRELGLMRLEHDLPIELKDHRGEHMSKIFMLIGLVGPILDYYERYKDLNLDAKDKPWVFSKYTVLKALGYSFEEFNKVYNTVCKTSYIQPIDISYLDCEGGEAFFNFVDKINKYNFDYYNREIMEKIRIASNLSEEDVKRMEEEFAANPPPEEEKPDYFLNKPPKKETKKKED